MGNGPDSACTKADRWVPRRATAAVIVAALALFPGSAAPQVVAGGGGSENRALSQDANGPERPGQALELAMLLSRRPRPPFADLSVSPSLRYQLRIAYDLAIRMLRKEPSCRALFAQLGTDGEAVLASTRYSDAANSLHCTEGVPAFTNVGSMQIRLCRPFATLEVSSAAVLLLHEALHSSGLRESPAYPNALTAKEITAVVTEGCQLL